MCSSSEMIGTKICGTAGCCRRGDTCAVYMRYLDLVLFGSSYSHSTVRLRSGAVPITHRRVVEGSCNQATLGMHPHGLHMTTLFVSTMRQPARPPSPFCIQQPPAQYKPVAPPFDLDLQPGSTNKASVYPKVCVFVNKLSMQCFVTFEP